MIASRLFLVSLGIPALLLAACSTSAPPVTPPRIVLVESPTPVTTVGAEVFPGTVHARIETDLSFRVPGKIAERRVEIGSRVAAHTVLATLDPQDARLNLDAARAAVAAAQADLSLAKSEETRYSNLLTRGFVAQSLVDTRINVTKLNQAKLDQARSQLVLAENQSRYTRLTSDASGVVTQVMAESGMVVAAGQLVMRFAEDGDREVRIAVPEGGIEALKRAPGLGVSIYSLPGKLYQGRIREINPQAEPVTRTHEARVTIVDADAAVPLGATASVLLGGVGNGKTFSLPASAVGTLGKEQPVVWITRAATDGSATTVEARPVQVLQYLDKAVIVSGEFGPLDRLVTAGVHLLVPGMAVVPMERHAPVAL